MEKNYIGPVTLQGNIHPNFHINTHLLLIIIIIEFEVLLTWEIMKIVMN